MTRTQIWLLNERGRGEVALLAVGGVLTLVDAVMSKRVRNGFALVRPPGHHAEREMALGFCIFNNVAIAGMNLTEESYGFFTDTAKRIAKEAGHERIVSVLEGGYHLEMMSRSAYIHLKHSMN